MKGPKERKVIEITIAANLENFLKEKFFRDVLFPIKQKFRNRYTKYAGAT